MGLALPTWGFGYSVSNLTGTPSAATPGTNFSSSATANTDGTIVSVISATTNDIHYIQLDIAGLNRAANSCQAMLDVVIDPAGGTSWSEELISDLVCGQTATPTGAGVQGGVRYHFPLYVKAGAAIGVRVKTQHTGALAISSGRVIVQAYGEPSRPAMWWCGQKVETLGVTAGCQGTTFTPGNTGTWGNWTNIGTSTRRYGAVQFGINGSDNTATAIGYHFQLGFNSAQLPGSPTTYRSNTTAEAGTNYGSMAPIWCNVPASTVWQIRGTASGTAELYDACVYGVY